ncbi:class I SAM-dependent methyltransferase [Methyloglobulus sp.]|uniref:class I SAM-dependent methyltransferase n=1 Tax=Methyloglobulus sp. TaxID=2518622 RepID=UPI00398A39BB
MEDKQKIFAARVLFAVGLILSSCSVAIFTYIVIKLSSNQDRTHNLVTELGTNWVFGSLGVLLVLGISFMALPLLSFLGIKKMEFSRGGIGVDFMIPATNEITPRKNISEEVIQEKFEYAKTYVEQNNTQLPGQFAPDFQVLDEKLALTVTPCADPMTPMYMLDRNFRVIDWNIAFNLCFDRTLEGRHGKSILEWTYFLDNYEEVLSHGIEVFAEGKILPRIDIEKIQYTSDRYGKIEGVKRAYQVPDDDGNCLGWLITINPTFMEAEKGGLYQTDVFTALRKTLMWSEYALCYDKILNNSLIYPELIHTLAGNYKPGPLPIRESSVILDIGAGTGNVSFLLAQQSPKRLIIAIDNNPLMLNTLRRKCQAYLRQDAQGSGIIAMKQDVVSLFGLSDEFFDYVIINNVLYSLDIDAALCCLKEAWRVLKPGGEIRISEPQKCTDLSKVLEQIRSDLKKNGKYTELEADFLKLCQINEFSLQPLLHRWTLDEMEKVLLQDFSSISYKTDRIYAGQSMLICANK